MTLEVELHVKVEDLEQKNAKLEKDLADMTSLFGRLWLANDRTRTAYNDVKRKLNQKEAELNNLKIKIREALGDSVSG